MTPEGHASPITEVKETWSEGVNAKSRVRRLWSDDPEVRGEDLSDPYGEEERSAKMRRAPAPLRQANNPYFENSEREPIHASYLPEFAWEFAIAEAGKAAHLASLIREVWIPMAWKHYSAAGLPWGALVFRQDPTTGQFAPEIAPSDSHEHPECPAWRLPAAFRSDVDAPESIAGQLIYIACALAEAIDPHAPRLRERFADNPEGLERFDPAVLAAKGAELFATLQLYSPWPAHPTGKSLLDAGRAGVERDQAIMNKLKGDWRTVVDRLRAAYAAGEVRSQRDYARIVQDAFDLPDLTKAVDRVVLYEACGLIVPVRGNAGRKAGDE